MPRMMSCRLTADAVRDRRKTVTRRLGWEFLRPGHRLTLVVQAQGLRKGQKVERLAEVEVVTVIREPLNLLLSSGYAAAELPLEGMPAGMTGAEFIDKYFVPQGADPSTVVTRIGWRYLDEEA